MGLFISFLAVFLVLFLLVAMALAEWTNRDVIDLMTSWIPKLRVARAKAAATPAARLDWAGPDPTATPLIKARKPVGSGSGPAKRKATATKARSGKVTSKTKTTTSRTRKTK